MIYSYSGEIYYDNDDISHNLRGRRGCIIQSESPPSPIDWLPLSWHSALADEGCNTSSNLLPVSITSQMFQDGEWRRPIWWTELKVKRSQQSPQIILSASCATWHEDIFAAAPIEEEQLGSLQPTSASSSMERRETKVDLSRTLQWSMVILLPS